jgi:hypothetical protein
MKIVDWSIMIENSHKLDINNKHKSKWSKIVVNWTKMRKNSSRMVKYGQKLVTNSQKESKSCQKYVI